MPKLQMPRRQMPRLRWLMITLCFAAGTINYIDRANLAVAAPFIRHQMHIGPVTMGLILSGFFWTYAVMQMPFGWFADRIGPRIALAVAVVWWSVFTSLTAAANSVATLFGCRLMLGVGEAGAYPACTKVVAAWFPRGERTLASAIFDSGARTGTVLSLPVVTLLIGHLGWKASFAITGLLGLVWLVFWLKLYREPEDHPGVTPAELHALQQERQRPETGDGIALRWIDLFRYRSIWAMMIGFFCLNFAIYFFITWFPTYLIQARGFSLAQLGTLGALPGLIAIPAEWLGGYVSDSLYRRGWSLTAARKTCLVGGMLMSSVITLSVLAPNAYVALALFALSYSSLAFTGANIWTLPSDMAPTQAHVASIGGIQNFASNLAGIFISTFTGVMLLITHGSFAVPLTVAGALCLVGAGVYLFMLGPVEPLPIPGLGRERLSRPAGGGDRGRS
jgi:ACS family D-galactonate transporter-like MFS transporter